MSTSFNRPLAFGEESYHIKKISIIIKDLYKGYLYFMLLIAGLDLSTGIFALLVLCILAVCFFEFVNGFHDTANAVATVIYTHSLKPT